MWERLKIGDKEMIASIHYHIGLILFMIKGENKKGWTESDIILNN